ncbi:MAG TPA: ABC transporter permease [Fimbriimonas sp.]|nr:ABC transporter permease [Fimbriimonas sp.]
MGKLLSRRETVPAILVVIAFIAGIVESPKFLDFRYLLNVSPEYAETGIMALGMTLVIVCAEIDLSVASILALVACVVAKMLDAGWGGMAAVCGLLLGTCLGGVNGVLVGKLKLPSFVVTLATMALYRGIAQAMLGAHSVKMPHGWIGVDMLNVPGTPFPIPLVLFAVLAVGVGLLLHRTVFGRWIYMTGTNPSAALYSGLPVERVKVLVFTITGFLAAISALLMDSRLGVARYDHALGQELDVITVVVLGGTSIFGGEGAVLANVLALLLIAFVHIGLYLANVTGEFQLAVIGTLLVVAVMISTLVGRRQKR